ncbi:hypothetical protein E2C01_061459 [Portunus trituberculatus]|uniref:Uncharacterized protein n=1 Tax=Portunus trituberculatus TaxID=210409 RepID=A0A5B7HBB8_PORTR|nr:hypothetical protein [Portunus trituberculatus]
MLVDEVMKDGYVDVFKVRGNDRSKDIDKDGVVVVVERQVEVEGLVVWSGGLVGRSGAAGIDNTE